MSIREKQMSIRYTDPDTLKEYIVGAAGIDIDNDTLVSENGVLKVADEIANTPTEIATVSSYLEDQKEKGFLKSPNLIKGTDDWSGEGWINKTSYRISSQKLDGCTVLEKYSAWNGISKYINLKANKKYIFSVYVKSDDTVTVSLQGLSNNYSTVAIDKRIEIGKDWQRISLEYTPAIDQDNFAFAVFARSNVNHYVAKYMVEESETLSEYLPFNSSNTELTEKIYDVEKQVFSKNRYNPLDVENGYLYNSSGAKQSVATWGIAHIKVKGLSTISISGLTNFSSVNVSYRWEDSNKTAISSIPYARLNNANEISVPSGAEYIGVSVIIDSTASNYGYDKLQVEEGSTATSYVPYAKSNVELTEELFSPHIISKTNGSKVTNGNYFKIYRIAKIIIIHATFQIGSATSGTEPLFTLNETVNVNTGFSTTGNDNKSYRLSLSNNIISVDGVSLPAQWYSGTAVFVEE